MLFVTSTQQKYNTKTKHLLRMITQQASQEEHLVYIIR